METQIGVPVLDRLLDVFQVPAKARSPEQRSQHTQWSTQAIIPNPPPTQEKRPPVIEVTGVSACSGKTQLLYYIIAVTLLPHVYEAVTLRGKDQAVVLFDLSCKFSILRLRDIMRNYIADRSSTSELPFDEEKISPLIHTSLIHLHVFRPQSTPSLLSTLSSLPAYLLSRPSSHFSANRPLGLLAINDISAFYQQDRLDSEEAQAIPPPTDGPNTTAVAPNLLQGRYKSLTAVLQDVSILFSAPIIATNTALSSFSAQTPGQPSLRPHLPAVWNNFCTLQLVVERDRVTKFGPGMSVKEASGERGQRWEAVTRSGFSGWVNWWGSGGWREEVREGLRKLDGGGGFRFQVGDRGVVVHDGRREDRSCDEGGSPP